MIDDTTMEMIVIKFWNNMINSTTMEKIVIQFWTYPNLT